MTAPLGGQALSTVVPMPSARLADMRDQGVPSEVTEQSATVAILLSTMGQMGLLTTLMALTMVGMM